MRVLFVCPSLAGGGAERQWSVMVPELARRGLSTRVLTLDGEGPFFEPIRRAGVPITCARMRSRYDLAGLARGLRFALHPRPHVVVSRDVSAQVVGHLIARLSRATHITTEHSPCDAAARFLPMSRHRRLLARLVAPRIDRVVAVSDRQRVACEHYGYRADRLEVIENGLSDVGPSLRAVDEVRHDLGLAHDDVAFLLVAGLRPEKRALDFLDAIQVAHAIESRVRGFLVGDGSLRGQVSARLNRARGVEWLGFRDDVADLMNAADAICLTSSHEALPMVVLEAMASGRAVLATRVGGVPDVVVDGETGLLFDVGDIHALAAHALALAADPARAVRLGAAGRERQARLYTADRNATRYAHLIRRAKR